MASAKDILDQRLAKGEISLEEHKTLSEHIAAPAQKPEPTPEAPPPQPATTPQQATPDTSFMKFAKIAGGVVVVLVVIGWFNSSGSSKGLVMGNLSGTSSRVLFDIVNNSKKTGDVLVWVEQNDIKKCYYKFYMKANWRITNKRIPCGVSSGKFSLRYAWATSYPKKASVARRAK